MDELVGKWKSYPEDQHTPLCAHQLVLAMKTITQLALGESFSEDARVISFRKNHDAVSHPETTSDTTKLFVIVLFFGELVWLINSFFCTPKHLDTSRSGQKLAKVTWMVRWREAPAEKDVMRQVSQKNL